MSEPIRAEWAGGRRKFSLALLMLWVGGGWLAISLIIGLQVLAVPRMGRDLGSSSLLIPGWALVAVGLALLLRFKATSRALRALSITWLLIGAVTIGWFVQAHA